MAHEDDAPTTDDAAVEAAPTPEPEAPAEPPKRDKRAAVTGVFKPEPTPAPAPTATVGRANAHKQVVELGGDETLPIRLGEGGEPFLAVAHVRVSGHIKATREPYWFVGAEADALAGRGLLERI